MFFLKHILSKCKRKARICRKFDPFLPIRYDPFAYIFQPERDIPIIAKMLYINSLMKDQNEDVIVVDLSFVRMAIKWLEATIGYLWYEAPSEDQNISTLLMLLEEDGFREDEFYENPVDMLFEELEEKDPQNYAVKQWNMYKIGVSGDFGVHFGVHEVLKRNLSEHILFAANYKLWDEVILKNL